MPGPESPAHLELKRLSMIWAQANGYSVAATEVSLPNLRFRIDVAAYRPGSVRLLHYDDLRKRNRWLNHASLGLTAVFECKANRPDLIRDCRQAIQLSEKIRILTETKIEMERHLKITSPSLLNGDGLWPEYETAAFEKCTDIVYQRTVRALKTLRFQIQGQTKMENLLKWKAANLHYLVVEEGIVRDHEVPPGWGLLVRTGNRLEVKALPEFQEIPPESKLLFLHRVAAAGTKSANREMGASYAEIEAERHGLDPPSQR